MIIQNTSVYLYPGIATVEVNHQRMATIIGDFFEIAPMQWMMVRDRKREIAQTRQIFHFFMKLYTRKSLKSIGEITGKDHSTILNSIKTVRDLCDIDSDYRNNIIELDKLIMREFDIKESKLKL